MSGDEKRRPVAKLVVGEVVQGGAVVEYLAVLTDFDGDEVTCGQGETETAALCDLVQQLAIQVELATDYSIHLGGTPDGFDAFAAERWPDSVA